MERLDAHLIPSKLEGVTFGQDAIVHVGGQTLIKHTLYVGNDNDYLTAVADPLAPACVAGSPCSRAMVPYPNQIFVFAFDDGDLPGYVPQQIKSRAVPQCGLGD